MNHHQWLFSVDSSDMINHLINSKPKTSDRKFRLFACAVMRFAWNDLTNENSRHAVRVAEAFADGEANDVDLDLAEKQSRGVWLRETNLSARTILAEASRTCDHSAVEAANYVTQEKPSVPLTIQAGILHEIIGDPFREGIGKHRDWYLSVVGGCRECDNTGYLEQVDRDPLDDIEPCPACRTPITELPSYRQAVAMAKQCYDSYNFDKLTMLAIADALEECGCHGIALDWFRAGKPRFRGDWVIDLLRR